MYDAAQGRFISRDPIGYVDGMSLYRGYFAVEGNDPSGTVVVADRESHEDARGRLFAYLSEICRDCAGSKQATCTLENCLIEAAAIAKSFYYTLKRNHLLVVPSLTVEHRYKGRYCYEWAFGFEDAIKNSKCYTSKCFEYELQGALTPPDAIDQGARDVQHFWVRIYSNCSNKEFFVDDGYGSDAGLFVHDVMPIPNGMKRADAPEATREECRPAVWYDYRGSIRGEPCPGEPHGCKPGPGPEILDDFKDAVRK